MNSSIENRESKIVNVLLVVPQLPWPPRQGTSLRNYHILRGLAEKYVVSLLSVVEAERFVHPEAVGHLETLCERVETAVIHERTTATRLRQMVTTRLPDIAHRLYSEALVEKLTTVLQEKEYDVVQIEGIELARLMATVREVSPQSKLIFDDHNAEAALQRRNLQTDLRQPRRWVAAAYSAVQVGRLSRLERWACQMADHVLAVSEPDKATLEVLVGKEQRGEWITAVPNSIDVSQYAPTGDEPTIPFDVVFSGKMDYRPNVDAVLWFGRKIWPHIVAERPESRWGIVGQKPHARLEELRGLPGVTITGWVEAVQPYLHGATVLVMPFRIGSGTRLKLIEGMAAGKPLVSTRMGVEGFAVTDGQEILLRDEAVGMKTAVLELLENGEKRAALGKAAQAFAQQYDWRAVAPLLWKTVAKLTGK